MTIKPNAQSGISALEFQKIQIILSEKRTAHTTFRSGVVLCVLPLSIISFLLAISSRYNVAMNRIELVSILIVCCGLLFLGGYLVIRGLSRVKFHDHQISKILVNNSELASIFFHTHDGRDVSAKSKKKGTMHNDIVFHFDKGEAELNIAISNIKNYFDALKDKDFTAVLVINGPGIQLMGKDGKYSQQLQELHDAGLRIRVCNNAMHHFNLQPDFLNAVYQIIPAGILEIVDLQRNGFVYLKP